MMIYISIVCALLLLLRNPIKCSESGMEQNDKVDKTISSDSEESSRSMTSNKERKRYLNYKLVRPHSRQMTAAFETLLTRKEGVLETKMEFIWEDVHKYPLQEYKKYWNNFCRKMWPGITEHSEAESIEAIETFCLADLFPLGKSGYLLRGFKHDYDPEAHKNVWPFTGDFISCDCKYILGSKKYRAVDGTRRYFFAMKIDEREYFLLIRADQLVKEKKTKAQVGRMLKIVDYVMLPEWEDINLNV